ncbi:hypothetical protein FRC20_001564 [Serendipita sp. 405]|nr:hypothetical protein FRC20_001564 [Serendipita sp. 405]
MSGSKSTSDAPNASQTSPVMFKSLHLSLASSSQRRKFNLIDQHDQENVGPSLQSKPASPDRSGHLSAPFTPSASPLRRILSPLQSILSSKSAQPSPRGSSRGTTRRGPRLSGEDLIHDLTKNMFLPGVKNCLPSLTKSAKPTFSELVGPLGPKTGKTLFESWLFSPDISARDNRECIPEPASPKSKVCSNSTGGEDTTQEPVEQLQIVAGESLRKTPSKAVAPSSSKLVVAIPSKSDGASGDASRSEAEGSMRSNPILIYDQLETDGSIPNEPLPSLNEERSPPSTEEKKSDRRKRRFKDDDEAKDSVTKIRIAKKLRLNSSRQSQKAQSEEDRCEAQFCFETGAETFHWFDELNNIWMSHTEEPNDVVDDQSTRNSGQNTTNNSVHSNFTEWSECKMQRNVAAAPHSAAVLYKSACRRLQEYKAQIDLGSEEAIIAKARESMEEAWREWHRASASFITLEDLRQYGDALDAEGRQAMANALEVQSDLLNLEMEKNILKWIEEPLTQEEKERRRLDREAALAPKEPTSHVLESVNFADFVTFGDDEREEDVATSLEEDIYPLVYDSLLIPSPLLPTAPLPSASLSPAAQSAAVPGMRPASLAATFVKTPTQRLGAGKLPPWAREVLYCNSHLLLEQWMEARARELTQSPNSLGEKAKWIIDELSGSPRGDLTPTELQITPATRAFNGLPDDQKPVLLDGQGEVKSYNKKESPGKFVVICRMSFRLDKDGQIEYGTSPCGHVVSSHDILIRHVKEKHFGLKRPRKATPGGGTPKTADNPQTASTSEDTTTPDPALTSDNTPP